MNASPPASPRSRGRFTGMLNIVRFNAPMYATALGVITAAATVAGFIPLPLAWTLLLFAGAAAGAFFLVISLAVSHLIYDCSDLYRWGWLRRLPPLSRGIFINLHAGFDETSEPLRRKFPEAEWRIWDFYNPSLHTEPSIARARKYFPPSADTESVRPEELPLANASAAAVFSVLAAHEIRTHAGRLALAREVRRTLRADGVWVVAEHLRDAANFAAFGPGFLHFFSRRAWRRVFTEAGLRVAIEFQVTPFVAVFVLRRDD